MATTVEPPQVDEETTTVTKRQPPYAVVVLNDDDHTFQYVITVFQKVFNYKIEKCVSLAEKIHFEGRAIVWSGSFEVAELKSCQIKSAGPDKFAKSPKNPNGVNYPLGVELEPLA